MSRTVSMSSVPCNDEDVFSRHGEEQHQDSSPGHIYHISHPVSLLQQLNVLRNEESLTDVRLETDDGQHFPCHRVILAAACPYFSAMFTTRMGERDSDQITLHDIAGPILNQFIDYCYTGSLKLTDQSVHEIAEVANFLQFTAVEEECVRFLQRRLSAANCLETEQVANRLFNRQLSAQAHGYSVGNFTDVTFSEEFLEFSQEQVEDFISRDVCVDSEEEVYEAVMRWIYHDKEERKSALGALMEKILFEVMTEAYVLEIAAKEPLLREFDSCMKIVKRARSFHAANGNSINRTLYVCSSELNARVQSMRNFSEVMVLIGDLDFRHHVDGVGQRSSNVLMYNPKLQKWDELLNTPFGGDGEFTTAATVVNNNVLVCTNQHRVWLYRTCQNKWSLLTNRMVGRNGGCLVTLHNQAFILGGLKPVETSRMTSVQRFDLVTKQWIEVAPMANALTHSAAVACLDKIYIIGSTSGSRYVADMFCYSPLQDACNWVDCPPLPSRLMRPKIVAINGSLYVLGHQNDFAMAMFQYDVKKQQWTIMDAPMVPRHGATVAVCNNKLFLLGGKVLGSDYSEADEFTIECYDPDSEIWSIHGDAQWLLNGHQTVTVLNPAFPPARYLGPKQH